MIRAVIQAGFGNQLFQYATAYSLARELGQELELDVSFYEDSLNINANNRRKNNLLHLQLDYSHFYSKQNSYSKFRYITRFKFLQNKKIEGKCVPIICEDVSRCRENQMSLFKCVNGNGAILYGFWQNTCYFDKYLFDLNRQFKPNYLLEEQVANLLDEIKSKNSVGVHIRRGDFVGLGWDKGKSYYDKGITYFRERVKGCRFFIVSDDVGWVREQYGLDSDIRIVDVNTTTKDIDEFFLLSSCNHQLISESTYGWWAAYLNLYKDKIVVAPIDAKGDIFECGWHRI